MGAGGSTRLVALQELAAVFLKLGATAFGGPAAHIGLLEQEVVRKRGWLTHQEFLDLLGATNLIPGPNSTEMAIHIGLRRAGWLGLMAAGVCFILPATGMVMGLAWAYVRFGSLPEMTGLLYGVKPVMIAVVLQALWGLTRAAVKSWPAAAIGVAAAILNYLGVNELLLLLGVGLVLALVGSWNGKGRGGHDCDRRFLGLLGLTNLPVLSVAGLSTASAVTPFSMLALFLFFLKIGSVLFGSGYVLLAFLRADLVERWHWLSQSQLLDAVAVGQITPGPLFTTATFVGYLLGGPSAALLATIGIFLPAFVFVALSGPLIPHLRKSPAAGAFLDGVNMASLALMAVVTLQLSAAALVDPWTVLLAAGAGFLLIRYRINSAWLVLGGAVFGLLKRGL
jgi:chromate transporter